MSRAWHSGPARRPDRAQRLLACRPMADADTAAGEATPQSVPAPAPAAEPEDHSLIVDELAERFDQFRVLRKADPEATDRLLDEIGAHHQVDRDIVLELSATRALGQPGRFRSAHELVMRSLEVLDRNGARGAKLDYVGPAEPVAQFAVQFFTRLIVRNYESDVIDAVRNLYTRRLAWCAPDDPHRHVLAQARLDAVRATPTYKRNAVGIPGSCSAAPSSPPASGCCGRCSTGPWPRASPSSSPRWSWSASSSSRPGRSWKGAAVARRRIRLTTERPLAALWQTIGRCGKPPEDQARQFAIIALVVMLVGALVIPAAIAFVVARFSTGPLTGTVCQRP